MKVLLLSICTLFIGISLLLPSTAMASSHDKKKSSAQNAEKDKATVSDKKNTEKKQTVKQKTKVTNNLPIYKPPLRGAPAGRVAGGTRGPDQEIPYLCLIVPEHIGLTISRQPVLYYYQSKASSYPIEFTLIEKHGVSAIVETRIAPSKTSGIQSVSLADYGVFLEKGVEYKWFIALVPDLQHRSRDILAAGGIEFIEQSASIKEKLKGAAKHQKPYLYAESGLWYDAFYALSSLIEESPDDNKLRNQRVSLLEQIELIQVAEDEKFAN